MIDFVPRRLIRSAAQVFGRKSPAFENITESYGPEILNPEMLSNVVISTGVVRFRRRILKENQAVIAQRAQHRTVVTLPDPASIFTGSMHDLDITSLSPKGL